MKITENFLVVSNYHNDIAWVPEYAESYVVYDQSEHGTLAESIDPGKVIKSPHLGHNVRDYCTFIIDNYDALPERTIFVAGNVFPRHVSKECFERAMNSRIFAPIEDAKRYKARWPMSFISSDGGYCERNDSWYLGHHPTKYFGNYDDFLRFCFVDPVIPRYVRFAPGANYVVPREHILRLPKVFYENLRTVVSHCPTAIPGESHIIERAFHTLWTSPFEVSERMRRPIAADFVPKRYVPRTLAEKALDRVEALAMRAFDALRRILAPNR